MADRKQRGEREMPSIQNMLRVIKTEISDPQTAEPEADEKRDFGVSYDMLQRVADFIDLLQQRLRALEHDKRALIEAGQADLASANETARQWQDMSTALKSKLDECARQLADAKLRAETAERRADSLFKLVEVTEERAVKAEELSRNYHDRILASFGNSSRLSEMLRGLESEDEQGF